MQPVTIHYRSRRGGYATRYVPANDEAVAAVLKKLKCEARAVYNGVEVGKVWKNDGSWGDGRKVWLWSVYLDTALEER